MRERGGRRANCLGGCSLDGGALPSMPAGPVRAACEIGLPFRARGPWPRLVVSASGKTLSAPLAQQMLTPDLCPRPTGEKASHRRAERSQSGRWFVGLVRAFRSQQQGAAMLRLSVFGHLTGAGRPGWPGKSPKGQ